ncbi:MAG: helix-turn-helix domain-containing protein [Candidatus Acidiferrum sp.]
MENTTRQPLLVSKKEAALALGLSLRTIDAMIARKELASITVGKRRLVKFASVVAFTRTDHVGPSVEA